MALHGNPSASATDFASLMAVLRRHFWGETRQLDEGLYGHGDMRMRGHERRNTTDNWARGEKELIRSIADGHEACR